MQIEFDGRTSNLTKTLKDVFRYFDESSLKATRTGRWVPLVTMTKGLERTIKMADRSYKGPFVALSLCVASRTRTRFFVIFLAASIVFGISVSVDYTQYLVFW